MTATPPDPEPDTTPGVEPGATPPESGQTSGLSHPQPIPSKGVPVVAIVLAALGTLLVAALLFALAVGWLKM
ncbi:DUF6480 family protein [Amycolatopsis sp. YIM 10]|uniref:DUF6480 family protein n=1 Tax=Amycolatopsis sp. YIM 10 TaxID=2653857 RepID=UPI00128FD67A|nr:DUF6480 family protein [Amycolatopsis sp. YIM 10]QFU92188.1 hypothetical protein YIM_35140 [Amycolatopsis sp. YIM 10]